MKLLKAYILAVNIKLLLVVVGLKIALLKLRLKVVGKSK